MPNENGGGPPRRLTRAMTGFDGPRRLAGVMVGFDGPPANGGDRPYCQQNLPGVCPICGGASHRLPGGMHLACPECCRVAARVLGFDGEVSGGAGLGIPAILDAIFAPDAAARLRAAGLGCDGKRKERAAE